MALREGQQHDPEGQPSPGSSKAAGNCYVLRQDTATCPT